MNEEKARKILGKIIQGGLEELHDPSNYINWFKGNTTISLDGEFNADTLEAMAWWMKNKKDIKCYLCGKINTLRCCKIESVSQKDGLHLFKHTDEKISNEHDNKCAGCSLCTP